MIDQLFIAYDLRLLQYRSHRVITTFWTWKKLKKNLKIVPKFIGPKCVSRPHLSIDIDNFASNFLTQTTHGTWKKN